MCIRTGRGYFNSRPSARGDRASARPCRIAFYFNSRPSARGDGDWQSRARQHYISIHAPPRGATWSIVATIPNRYFNSRPSARGDKRGTMFFCAAVRFQFTPLREGRRACHARLRRAERVHFNSRPSARGDGEQVLPRRFCRVISIHAPPRGATDAQHAARRAHDISIHAPPRGATFFPMRRPSSSAISIHAPPRGATSPDTTTGRDNHISIHAPPRGATCTTCGHVSSSRFQFTPLREGRPAQAIQRCNVNISIHAPPRGAT